MKKTKKSHAIIILIVLLLALATGYAAFSSTLTINGTAEGTGTWDVHFKSATLKNAEGGVDSSHGTASLSATTTTNDTITATISLAYPGDGVILEAVVENNGNTPAVLKGFNIEGADTDLIITETGAPTVDEPLDANGGTCTAQFAVQWNPNSETTDLGEKTFTITYEYEQDTQEVILTPSHTHTDA